MSAFASFASCADEQKTRNEENAFPDHSCAVCGHRGRGTCSWCLAVHYCGHECQRHDWFLRHRESCKALHCDHRCLGGLTRLQGVHRPPERADRDLSDDASSRIARISRAAASFTASIRKTKARLEAQRDAPQHVIADTCHDVEVARPAPKIPWTWKAPFHKEGALEVHVTEQDAPVQTKIAEVATPSRNAEAPTTPEPKLMRKVAAVSTGRASLGGEADLMLGLELNASVNDEDEKLVESPTKAHIDEAVSSWRREVELISSCATSDEEAEDAAELHQLLEEQDSLARSEVIVEGARPVLVTAPHCIALLRDGQPVHLVEEYTSPIAQALAKKMTGSSLMWTSDEQRRVELLWGFAKKRSNRGHALLDPRNRDPNYLSTVELAGNPWHQQMLRTAASWRASGGQDISMLHVDVHGCRDPPHTPSHLTVGLGAMLTEARSSGDAERVSRVKAFGEALEVELTAVLNSMRLWPRVQLVRVIVPTAWEKHMRFAGAWAPSTQRHTNTQQASSCAGFEYSVQLEMSKVLRRQLLQNRPALDDFGGALINAWSSAQQRDRKSVV